MSKKVTMSDSIIINTSAEKLFDYIADGNNDPIWRTEVDRMDVQGAIEEGTIMVEYSSFYKFLHTVTPTEIKVLERPHKVVLETPDLHPTWLRSIRTIENIEEGKLKFTYELAFSLDSMKPVMKFTPPAKIVSMWYSPRIRKYLKNLKAIIENK